MPKAIISIAILSLLLCIACKQKSTVAETISYRQSAEFEPTAAIWLLWSNYDHKQGMPNAQVSLAVIDALVQNGVKVKLILPNDSTFADVQKQLNIRGLKTEQITLFKFPYREFWARDILSFVVSKNGLAIADFNFNSWGYGKTTDPEVAHDEKLDERLATKLNIPMLSTNLITEGGDLETNGQGTLIVTESVQKNRNPQMSLAEIEVEFTRILGTKKVIWLKQGLYEDDQTTTGTLKNAKGETCYTLLTTNGHTDEYVRFINPTTVLFAEVDSADLNDPIARENAKRLALNEQILKTASDQDGKPLTILKMPLPKLIEATMLPNDEVYKVLSEFQYRDRSVFPKGKPIKGLAAASYLNFLVANDVVLVAQYGGENRERDIAAQKILQAAFPNKKIISLNVLAVNLGGGGIHCITRNEPRY